MIKVNDALYTLVGRVLLGVLFLPAGLMKLMGFAGTARLYRLCRFAIA
jgi:uncharacterized membrane protein YphA (DoxX/SURF4 family)